MAIKEHLMVLDHYLDPNQENPEQKAISEALEGIQEIYTFHYNEDGKDRTRKMDYYGVDFKSLLATWFVGVIGARFGMIGMDDEFSKVSKSNAGLAKKLSELDILSTIRIAGSIDIRSQREWQTGRRGDLLVRYATLQNDYADFRKSLLVAMESNPQ